MQSLLELSDEQLFFVVVFVGDSTFKTDMLENVTYAKTSYGKGYIRFIKSNITPVLTNQQVKEVVDKIRSS